MKLGDVMQWISTTEKMPEEKDSAFSKYYGTEKWNQCMFLKISKKVLITFELESGERITDIGYTVDGEWRTETKIFKGHVTHWMPFPSPAE